MKHMRILLPIFLLALPFQWALSPTEGVDLAIVRIGSLLIVFCWAAASLCRRSLYLPDPTMLAFAASFIFFISASVFWAENKEWAFRKNVFLWTFFPLLLVFFDQFRDEKSRLRLIRFLLVGASAAALVAIVQFFSQFVFGVEKVFSVWTETILPFFLGNAFGEAVAAYPSLLVNLSGETFLRATAFFPDPHIAAFYFGLAFPFAFALFLKERSQTALFATSLLLLADFLTFSRGGYVGLALSAAVCFGMTAPRLAEWREKGKKFLAGIFLALIVAAVFSGPFGARFVSSFSLEDGSNSERLRLWKEAAAFVAERPFGGVGLGNYPIIVKPSASYREPIYAHNLYLDVAAETGLLGLFFFLGLLGTAILRSARRWRKEKDLFALATLLSLTIFSVHSLFETPIFSVHVLPLFLFLIAFAGSFHNHTETRLCRSH